MKAARYHGPWDVRIEDVPEPRPQAGEVLLEVVRAGICGTDASEFAHGPRQIPLRDRGPVIIGHEVLGRVTATGPGVELLQPGQRVVTGAGVYCGFCDWCRAGRTNLCASYYTLGLQADGGLAELMVTPAGICHPVPESCSDDSAGMAQPLAVAIHAVRRSGALGGQHLVLVGAGAIGSLILAAATAQGLGPVIVVDVEPAPLARALGLGAARALNARQEDAVEAILELTGGLGAPVVIEAAGTADGLSLATRVVGAGGRLLLVGLHPELRELNLADLVIREIDIVTTVAHVCDSDLPEAVRILDEGRVAAQVLDRVIPLAELVPRGLAPLAEGQAGGKILVDPKLG